MDNLPDSFYAIGKDILWIAGLTAGCVYAWKWLRLFNNNLPGPRGFPILGNISILIPLSRRTTHEYFLQLKQKYGKMYLLPGLFSLNSSVVVSDPIEAKRMLTEVDKFQRDEVFEKMMTGLLDHALFVYPTSALWKKHRKLIQPAFGPSHLRHAAQVSLNSTRDVSHIWDEKFLSKETIQEDSNRNSAKVAFGESLGSVQGLASGKYTRWKDLDAITTDRSILPSFLWKVFGVSITSPAVSEPRKRIHDFLHELIEKGRKEVESINGDCNMNMLHRLLLSNDKGIMTEDEIIGELLGFFLAGHETTSTTLTTLMLNLTQNPKVLKKLYEEIKDVDFNNGSIIETLSTLKYLVFILLVHFKDNVIRESQRLHSVVGSLGRISSQPVTVLGHDFPKGTRFNVYLRGIHLSEEYYEDPLTFNPDRWLKPIEVGTFLPFGDGPHNCIGQKMALIETKRYNFEMIEGTKIQFETTITHGLKGGLPLLISKRS
ncbi:hypothetical protein HDV02_000126 [Globomyces sp. JEL0801]|nr:hypothetical protein HDV02_000126 [Globomyces sp. JEL0801]